MGNRGARIEFDGKFEPHEIDLVVAALGRLDAWSVISSRRDRIAVPAIDVSGSSACECPCGCGALVTAEAAVATRDAKANGQGMPMLAFASVAMDGRTVWGLLETPGVPSAKTVDSRAEIVPCAYSQEMVAADPDSIWSVFDPPASIVDVLTGPLDKLAANAFAWIDGYKKPVAEPTPEPEKKIKFREWF